MSKEARGHVNQSLSDYSVKAMQDTSEFKIHAALFPAKAVNKMSDEYFIYDRANNFRSAFDIRANKSESNGLEELALSTSSFLLTEHALHELVSDRDRENADPAVDPELDATQDVMQALLRGKNRRAAITAFTSTSFGGGNLLTLSSNAWDFDTTTSSPIDDIDTARENITQNIGKSPMGICMGFKTFNVLKDHTDILDRIKFSERGIITEDILASVFGMSEVVVDKTIERTTNPGISATTDYMFQSAALVYWNEPNPRLRNSNFGTTFQKREAMIDKFRVDTKRSDMIEVTWSYDQKIVLSLSGFFIAATD